MKTAIKIISIVILNTMGFWTIALGCGALLYFQNRLAFIVGIFGLLLILLANIIFIKLLPVKVKPLRIILTIHSLIIVFGTVLYTFLFFFYQF